MHFCVKWYILVTSKIRFGRSISMAKASRNIAVIGHKNPDTDSICSAIAYAELKNLTQGPRYEAFRAGELNRETKFVLERFQVDTPKLCLDINPKICDVDFREYPGISGDTSLRKAWTMMRNDEIDTLPIVDSSNRLQGLIAVKDITVSNMDIFDTEVLAKSKTSYLNILETLEGTMITGNPDAVVESGRVFIGAATPESMEELVKPGDIVIMSNRYESQLCAIELGVSLLIVCNGAKVGRTIRTLAQQNNVAIMSVPFDTYAVAKLICQSAPVSYIMTKDNLVKFGILSPLDDVMKVMVKLRHRYFPVMDEDGRYCGMISRRNIMNMPRRQLIMLDHNEATQAVEGIQKAEILEVIDHHRIGRPETSDPVYFRNQPLGSTATIITQMYREAGIAIPPRIAGLLLAAILSDTLAFRSPTCTSIDKWEAEDLSRIAQVDMHRFASEMFEAGENLSGKTPEELLVQDYKVFTYGDIRFGICQVSFMTERNLQNAHSLLLPCLEDAVGRQRVDDLYVMLTNISETSSTILCAGANASAILHEAFPEAQSDKNGTVLPGIISRKKQFLPTLMNAYQQF